MYQSPIDTNSFSPQYNLAYKSYYYHHFANEDRVTERLNSLSPVIPNIVNSRSRFKPRQCGSTSVLQTYSKPSSTMSKVKAPSPGNCLLYTRLPWSIRKWL